MDIPQGIGSLAKTHSLLTGGNWDGMTVDHLVRTHLEAYADEFDSRVAIGGPEMKLPKRNRSPWRCMN